MTDIVDAYSRFDESQVAGIEQGAAGRGASRKRGR